MKKKIYKGPERRKFVRLDYISPIAFKICKKETISKLLDGYASNISEAGILCTIGEKVQKNDILWLSFDRGTLSICRDLEEKSLIYQGGIIGKVVRVESRGSSQNIGLQFITREEQNLTNIYPKIKFLKENIAISEEELNDEDAEVELKDDTDPEPEDTENEEEN